MTCTHQAPDSCRRCDGTSRDDWDIQRADQAAARRRAHRLRTDPTFRAAWLATFPPAQRPAMAAYAARTHGPTQEVPA